MSTNIVFKNEKWQIEGELTFSTVSTLLKQSQHLWKEVKTIPVDFSEVTQADSAALALLLEWKRFANRHQKQISFTCLPQQLLNLIKVSHLGDMLSIKEGTI